MEITQRITKSITEPSEREWLICLCPFSNHAHQLLFVVMHAVMSIFALMGVITHVKSFKDARIGAKTNLLVSVKCED
jgi:hypothetical protein